MFKPLRKGSWWISSESDSRWNCSGTGFVGGFECPPEAKIAIEKIKKQLDKTPPDDLEFGYVKD